MLTDALGNECLPKYYGGKLPIKDVDGKLIIELLKLFNYQFEGNIKFRLISKVNFFSL